MLLLGAKCERDWDSDLGRFLKRQGEAVCAVWYDVSQATGAQMEGPLGSSEAAVETFAGAPPRFIADGLQRLSSTESDECIDVGPRRILVASGLKSNIAAAVYISRLCGGTQDWDKICQDTRHVGRALLEQVGYSRQRFRRIVFQQRCTGHLARHEVPALFVNAGAKVYLSNAAASRHQKARSWFSVSREGRIRLNSSKDQLRLQELIESALNGNATYAIRIASASNDDFRVLTASPSPVDSGDPSLNESASVMIRLHPSHAPPVDPYSLQLLFGLTKAESRLAAALVAGSSVIEFADRTRVKVTTARWHLSNILRRAGVRTQGELISAVLAAMRYC